MPRHLHPDRAGFRRSLAGAAVRVGATLVGLALLAAAVVMFTTRDDPEQAGASEEPRTEPTAPDATPDPTSTAEQASATDPEATDPAPTSDAQPTAAPSVTPTARPTAEPTATAEPEPTVELPPTRGVLAQVLDGGAGSTRTQAVARRMRELGYTVVAVSPARCCYERTTALYTRGNIAHAEALRVREPRVVDVRANPNLSEQVHVHVVVGRDWR